MIYYESFIPSGSDQPENTRYNARQLVSIALSNAMGRDMSYEYARHVGKRFDASNRKNIIRLHSFSEKNEVLRCCQNTAYVFCEFWYWIQRSREGQHREGAYCLHEKNVHTTKSQGEATCNSMIDFPWISTETKSFQLFYHSTSNHNYLHQLWKCICHINTKVY